MKKYKNIWPFNIVAKKKAKKLSILKWQYIVDNNGSDDGLTEKYPEMSTLQNECAYCDIFVDAIGGCRGCPLVIKNSNRNITCFSRFHVFQNWVEKQSKESAQAVLDLIIKS